MANLTPRELTTVAQAGGFTTAEAPIMAAIAMGESSGQADVENPTHHKGLWQISPLHKDALALGDWRSPTINAKMARIVYKKQGFKAWEAYRPNNAQFKKWLAEASANPRPEGGPGPTFPSIPIPTLPDIPGAIAAFTNAFNAQLGKVAGNVTTVLIALVLLVLGVLLALNKPVLSTVKKGPMGIVAAVVK